MSYHAKYRLHFLSLCLTVLLLVAAAVPAMASGEPETESTETIAAPEEATPSPETELEEYPAASAETHETNVCEYAESPIVDGSASTTYVTDGYVSGDYRYPKINLSGGDVDSINTAIQAEYRNIPADCWMVDYEWAVSCGVLSVVIEKLSYYNDIKDYDVYNIDLVTRKSLAVSELLTKVGTDSSGYRDMVKSAINAYYKSMPYSVPASIRNKSLTDSSISSSMPYVSNDGTLYCVAKIYGTAGAEWYFHKLAIGACNTPVNSYDPFAAAQILQAITSGESGYKAADAARYLVT